MTDAERIAEYMVRIGDMPAPFTAEDVRILAANNNNQECGLLLAMLSDVRREEREACAEVLHVTVLNSQLFSGAHEETAQREANSWSDVIRLRGTK